MVITRRHIKAFVVALLNFKFPVSWGRRKRAKLFGFKSFEHPLLVKILSRFFDVRIRPKGDVEIYFRERDAVNKRRVERRLKHIISQLRSNI